MAWIITVIVGAIVGLIASAIMRTRQNYLMDIVTGIVGAFLARWVFGAVFGIGSAALAGTLTFAGIFWGVVGAVLLIAIVRGVQSLYVREERPGRTYAEEIRREEMDEEERRRRR